jgi:hypothetical protein
MTENNRRQGDTILRLEAQVKELTDRYGGYPSYAQMLDETGCMIQELVNGLKAAVRQGVDGETLELILKYHRPDATMAWELAIMLKGSRALVEDLQGIAYYPDHTTLECLTCGCRDTGLAVRTRIMNRGWCAECGPQLGRMIPAARSDTKQAILEAAIMRVRVWEGHKKRMALPDVPGHFIIDLEGLEAAIRGEE